MRARALADGLLLLSLVAAATAPSAAAQLPEGPGQPRTAEELVAVNVNVLTPPQDVVLLGQVVYDLSIEDLSVDRAPDGQGFLHTIQLDIEWNRTRFPGWNAFLGHTYFATSYGGDVHSTTATVQAAPQVQGQYMLMTVRATLRSINGPEYVDEEEILTRLAPFSLAVVDTPGGVPQIGPEEETTIDLVVGNAGQYPDTFLLQAQGPEGWFVSVQPRLALLPGETRTVPIHVLGPATRVFVPQESSVIRIQVRSEREPEVVYERAAIVVLEGVFIPGYWLPLLALGAVLAVGAGAHAAEAGRRRAKEQGRPPPPRLTPAQQVLLADLKRRDPERHREFMAKQKGAFRARERAFMAVRGRRAALERALVAQQHRKVLAEKAQERALEQERAGRERELERRRGDFERQRERRGHALRQEQARAEAVRAREEERRRRAEAPMQRKLERERKAREAKLRAEMARKRRLLEVARRKRRTELERRTRLLEKRKRTLERSRDRRGKRPGGGGEEGPPDEA